MDKNEGDYIDSKRAAPFLLFILSFVFVISITFIVDLILFPLYIALILFSYIDVKVFYLSRNYFNLVKEKNYFDNPIKKIVLLCLSFLISLIVVSL